MARRNPVNNRARLLNALLPALFSLFLCGFSGTGYAQTALGLLDGFEAMPGPVASRPAAAAAEAPGFDRVSALILSAEKKVYLTTLALPGDRTGRRMAALLKDRRRAGLDVRLSVDDKEAEAFRPLLRELSAAGVQIRVFRLSYCSSLVPFSKLLLVDGRDISLEDGSETANSFILPQSQGAGLDDAIVFFFTANDDGSKPKSAKIMSSCQGAPQGSPLDDSIVFFFTANDDGPKPQ